jgi:hypothetical protein
MLALSGLREAVARGLVSPHSPPLLVPKNPAAKSCVSITSKLIEIKGLQLQHFGHLRKTGGRGSYWLVHTARLPVRKGPSLTPGFPPRLSRAPFERDARPTLNVPIFYILPTIGGGSPWSSQLALSEARFLRPACFTGTGGSLPSARKLLSPLRSTFTLQARSQATTPGPLRLAPQGARISILLDLETSNRSSVSNTKSGQRLGHTVRRRPQPRSASKPQFPIRRWGRKADRVRLGQRTLVG